MYMECCAVSYYLNSSSIPSFLHIFLYDLNTPLTVDEVIEKDIITNYDVEMSQMAKFPVFYHQTSESFWSILTPSFLWTYFKSLNKPESKAHVRIKSQNWEWQNSDHPSAHLQLFTMKVKDSPLPFQLNWNSLHYSLSNISLVSFSNLNSTANVTFKMTNF